MAEHARDVVDGGGDVAGGLSFRVESRGVA
jgi:hypothetical protein